MMVDQKLKAKAGDLIAAIHEWGLQDFVASNHAYQTLCQVLDAGTSMMDGSEEPEEMTEECLRVFGKPTLWGLMDDELWFDFCMKWDEQGISKTA